MSSKDWWEHELNRKRKDFPQLFAEHKVNLEALCSNVDVYFKNPSQYQKNEITKKINNLKTLLQHNPNVWNKAFNELLNWLEGELQRDKARVERGRTMVLVPFKKNSALEMLNSTLGLPYQSLGGEDGKTKVTTEIKDRETSQFVEGWKKVKEKDAFCAENAWEIHKLSDMNDVLYIRGHCNPGAEHLSANVDRPAKITVWGLVNMMIGKGLPKQFPGAIKIFACHSASSDNKPSFCQRFTDAMHYSGYKSCSFWGYKGWVSMSRGRVNGSPVSNWGGPDDTSGVRASEIRIRISPNCLEKDEKISMEFLLKKFSKDNYWLE